MSPQRATMGSEGRQAPRDRDPNFSGFMDTQLASLGTTRGGADNYHQKDKPKPH